MTLDDLRGDFRLVLFLIWRHLNLPDPTPTQLRMAEYLQHGPKRRMVMGFRGVGKSWITAAFVIWYLLKNPDANVVVVSANDKRAKKFTTFVLRLVNEIPELASLRPRGNGQRKAADGFDVGSGSASQTQSVTCVGIFGTFTGDRADLLVADDVEVPKNSETATLRGKLEDRTREFSALIKPESGHIVYLGTPQSEESIYRGLPGRGFHVRVWPILYPTAEERAIYGSTLAPDISELVIANPALEGTSTEPTRFTAVDIEERRNDYKEAGFQRQFMLNPSKASQGEYPLRLSDLLTFPLDYEQGPEKILYTGTPENIDNDVPNLGFNGDHIYRSTVLPGTNYVPYEAIIMTVDPSGAGRDETGWAVLAALNGKMYLLDCGGVPDHSTDARMELLDMAAKYKVHAIYCEPNWGGGTFTKLLQSDMKEHAYRCAIKDSEWARGQKAKRVISILAPIIQGHRLVVNRALFRSDYDSTLHLPDGKAQIYRLFYQMTRITGLKDAIPHDDRIEAVAIACFEMARVLGVSEDQAIDQRKKRQLGKQIEDFIRTAKEGSRWRDKEKAAKDPLKRRRGKSALGRPAVHRGRR